VINSESLRSSSTIDENAPMNPMLLILAFAPAFSVASLDDFNSINLRYFKGAGEPSLRKSSSDILTFRLNEWAEGHGPAALFVRVEINQGAVSFVFFGYSSFPEKWSLGKRQLNDDELIKLKSLYHSLNFERIQSNDTIEGFGGVTVVLEGVEDGNYHYVYRWSPQSRMKDRGLVNFMALREELLAMHQIWYENYLSETLKGNKVEQEDGSRQPESVR